MPILSQCHHSVSHPTARTAIGRSLFAFLLAIPIVHGGDWPQWRGPEQNGVSRERDLIDHWSIERDSPQNIVWQADYGGRATPIIMRGKVFLGRSAESRPQAGPQLQPREQVVCLDAQDGSVVWQDEWNVFHGEAPESAIGHASLAADADTGCVYMHSVSGLLRCYEPDGKHVWERSLCEEFGRIIEPSGKTQPPIIDEERVIVGFVRAASPFDSRSAPHQVYYAFDKRDGDLMWATSVGESAYGASASCPVVAIVHGVRLLIACGADGRVAALHARTGDLIWTFDLAEQVLDATPVVSGNRLFATYASGLAPHAGRLQCIDARGVRDITASHGLWQNTEAGVNGSALLWHNGIVFAIDERARLHAIADDTGHQLWVHPLTDSGVGAVAAPVWADGKIYMADGQGRVSIVRPSRTACAPLSVVPIKSRRSGEPEPIVAAPAISQGKIYITTLERILCLGSPDRRPVSDRIPSPPTEQPRSDTISRIQLIPYEAGVIKSGRIPYELRAYDNRGRFVMSTDPHLIPDDRLPDARVVDTWLSFAKPRAQAGEVAAIMGGLHARARVKVYPRLPWKWDFESLGERPFPPTWVGLSTPYTCESHDGSGTLKKSATADPLFSRHVWIGPPVLRNCSVQADVHITDDSGQIPTVGLFAQRYRLLLRGDRNTLSLDSTSSLDSPATRSDGIDTSPSPVSAHFPITANAWYTMKLQVAVEDEKAEIRGKAWKRDDSSEPNACNLTVEDAQPHLRGSPGLYASAAGVCYFDNVMVEVAD